MQSVIPGREEQIHQQEFLMSQHLNMVEQMVVGRYLMGVDT